jgi:hypothetical protein
VGLARARPDVPALALAGQAGGSTPRDGAPTATAGFVSAYAHGDIATVERVASPLYSAEWARRGVSLGDQASVIQEHQRAPSGEWLFMSYETGFVDGHGFGHYIYVGRPVSTAGSPSPSVWRVDSDPEGQVIWIEMVWLFSGPAPAVDALPPASARSDNTLQSLLPSRPSDVLFGVHSGDGIEGYYGVGPAPESASARDSGVKFYVVDGHGSYHLTAWTYGERIPNRPQAGKQQLRPEQASTLAAYLSSIR